MVVDILFFSGDPSERSRDKWWGVFVEVHFARHLSLWNARTMASLRRSEDFFHLKKLQMLGRRWLIKSNAKKGFLHLILGVAKCWWFPKHKRYITIWREFRFFKFKCLFQGVFFCRPKSHSFLQNKNPMWSICEFEILGTNSTVWLNHHG